LICSQDNEFGRNTMAAVFYNKIQRFESSGAGGDITEETVVTT